MCSTLKLAMTHRSSAKFRATLWLLGAAALLGGCGGPSKHPLSDASSSMIDTRLLGRWVDANDPTGKKNGILTISQVDDAGPGLVVRCSTDTSADQLFTTNIGPHSFFSLQSAAMDGRVRWFLGRYEIQSPDRFRVWILDEEKVIDAIRAGRLKGTIERVRPTGLFQLFPSAARDELQEVTSTTKELREYFEVHSDDCFDLKDLCVEHVRYKGDEPTTKR